MNILFGLKIAGLPRSAAAGVSGTDQADMVNRNTACIDSPVGTPPEHPIQVQDRLKLV